MQHVELPNLGYSRHMSELKRREFAVPPLNEQVRIAEILTNVDDSIRATEAVISQAERVKRGLMEDLLTGGLGSEAIARGEVQEGWEASSFEDLVQSMDGGVSVNSQNTPAKTGEKGVLKTSAVSNGWFDIKENKVVSDDIEIARLKEPVQAGTIIFSRMNTPQLVGANAFVSEGNIDVFLPDRLWAIKPNTKLVDASWLGFWMHHQFITGVFEALGSGTSGSMKNISKKKLNALNVGKPPLEQQQHAVDVLRAANDQISLNQVTLSQLQRLKRGLMDDLLTGRVRTV
jgi:type I restriction enzyme S subunit